MQSWAARRLSNEARASEYHQPDVAPDHKRSRHWSLPVALIDPTLKVFRYTNVNTGRKECFSEEELGPDAGGWKQGELITTNSGPLQLTGDKAVEYGLARTVEDFNEFRRSYGIESDLPLVEPGWADFLIGVISTPSMLGFLLFLGLAGIIAETYAPGHGIGGFVALVAFVLYFWIQYLHGTAGWLPVLLFVAGLGCLLLEIFVLPGFAIFRVGRRADDYLFARAGQPNVRSFPRTTINGSRCGPR